MPCIFLVKTSTEQWLAILLITLSSFVLSLVLKEYTDAIIIAIVILLNAFLSTFQEIKAEKALKSLSKLTSPTCIVRRNKKVIEIKTEDLASLKEVLKVNM